MEEMRAEKKMRTEYGEVCGASGKPVNANEIEQLQCLKCGIPLQTPLTSNRKRDCKVTCCEQCYLTSKKIMISNLDINQRASLIMEISEYKKVVTEPDFLNDVDKVVNIIGDFTSNDEESLKALQPKLKDLSEKPCFISWEAFQKAFFSRIPEQSFDRPDSSPDTYMNKALKQVIVDDDDRQGRLQFLKFMQNCSSDDFILLIEVFDLRINCEGFKLKDLDSMFKEIMIEILSANLTMNQILYKIENKLPLAVARLLSDKVDIGLQSVPDDIKSKFKENITSSEKERHMVCQISKALSEIEAFKLACLVIKDEIGIRESCNEFYDVFFYLRRKGKTVKDMILALVDANLFSGKVKAAITKCYGSPVNSMPKVPVAKNDTLPEYMSGEIWKKMVDLVDRRARIRLIQCLKKCNADLIKAMAFFFTSQNEMESIVEGGYSMLMKEFVVKSTSVDDLLSFLKQDECNADLIDILAHETDVNEKLSLSSAIPQKYKGIKFSSDDMRQLVSNIERNLRGDQENYRMLAILLVRNATLCDMEECAEERSLFKMYKHVRNQLKSKEVFFAAFHDLELTHFL